MPQRNPISGKKRTSPAPTSKPSSSGGEVTSSQIGNFTDTINLPYNVPVHEPNNLIPSDIYNSNSTSAPKMSQAEANEHLKNYNDMMAAQQVAAAGYSFISSVFKAQTSYQRALGDGFTALKETLSTQRKQVSAATTVVDLSTERLKFARAVQLNQQANIKLTGETVKTGLAQERMDVEISKIKNEIQALKSKAQQALLTAQSLELPS